MSAEQAKAFIEKIKSDEAFREKVMSIEGASDRIAFIRNEGFTCTEDEIHEVSAELDRVIGGESWTHVYGMKICGGQSWCLDY